MSSTRCGRIGLGPVLVVLVVGFVWGMLTHRNQWFPYGPMVALKRAVAPAAPAEPSYSGAHQDASSRSPAFAPLRALAYVGRGGVLADGNEGVRRNDAGAFPGHTLLYPRYENLAVLLDMDGNVVWEWSHPEVEHWNHVELLDDGGLIVSSSQDHRILRLDRESRLLWTQRVRVHHDLTVAGNEILALTGALREIPELHPNTRIYADSIVWLDLEDGAILRSLDLVDAVRASPYSYLLAATQHVEFPPDDVLDPLHTNHIEVVDGRFADRAPFYAAGGLLISMRSLNALAILDPVDGGIRWLWGPTTLTYQHHPSITPAGTVLVFNNGMENSEVLEVDPTTLSVVWHYTDDEFFSETRGSAQRLPNGNTLITESNTAYVFEVTPAGDKVWEYIGPWIQPDDGNRQPLWRATRFGREALPDVLSEAIENPNR